MEMSAPTSVSPAIRYERMVYEIVNRRFLSLTMMGYTKEDLVHEGLYAILRAEPYYNPKRGKESTYYYRAVCNWISSRIRTPLLERHCHRAMTYARSFDYRLEKDYDDSVINFAVISMVEDKCIDVQTVAITNAIVHTLMDKLASRHPKRYRALHMRYYDGLMDKEIAQSLGCSVQNVNRLIQFGLKDLRQYAHAKGESA